MLRLFRHPPRVADSSKFFARHRTWCEGVVHQGRGAFSGPVAGDSHVTVRVGWCLFFSVWWSSHCILRSAPHGALFFAMRRCGAVRHRTSKTLCDLGSPTSLKHDNSGGNNNNSSKMLRLFRPPPVADSSTFFARNLLFFFQ